MKKLFFALCVLAMRVGYADLDSGIYGSEQMTDPDEKQRPFNVYFSYDNVCSSNFSDKEFKHESQNFSEFEAELGAVCFYTPCFEEGGKLTLGYTYTNFHWKQNPFFHQNHFNYLNIELGFATKRITGWLWQFNFVMNQDTDHWSMAKFSNYDLLLWGRYNWNNRLGYHVGFLAYTGMNVNRLWPIIGFDYIISRKWKLNAVYPINISLVYDYNCNLALSLAGRAFLNRYRVGRHQPIPYAIFEYRNTGIELAADYKFRSIFKVNLHAGRTFGGNIRVSNQNHHNIRHLPIDSAWYFGGNLNVDF